ncbi:uncharacterized protein LOC114293047 [Camellia sinensis]|uniref:uncharacterized protein LOC114293047 n=1 Tax=Camellia sinensis TaxID=4442 RepID=UPI001035A8B3|nr:uncharacterized protein LOC114293047 [Camellia sinensis]
MSEPSEYSLRSGPYLGEISALCFLHLPPPHLSSTPYLLAGTGSQLLLYQLETGKMVKSFHVFQGIRVHGITTCSSINGNGNGHGKDRSFSSPIDFNIAVFGERRVKLFTLSIQMDCQFQDQPQDFIHFHLNLLHLLPKFSHWVLDVCFLKDHASSPHQESCCLAIGCSDNSVSFWDYLKLKANFHVRCPDRCLLYSMRIWGEKVEALRIASGTIYNEIIVWKVVHSNHTSSKSPVKDHVSMISSFDKGLQFHDQQYESVHMCRLAGHEGSIFRIAWFSDGSKLISVSDDRSARLWTVHAERKEFDNFAEILGSHSVGPVLFGHSARVWDCCIFDSLIVTAGEDCTCRVWGLDGNQLKMIREHMYAFSSNSPVPLAAVGVSIAIFNQASKVTIFPLVSITTSFVAEEDTVGRINREALEDENTEKISAKKNEMKQLTLEGVVLENLEEGLGTICEMKELMPEEGGKEFVLLIRNMILMITRKASTFKKHIFKLDALGVEILQIAFPAALALAADPIASLIDTAFIGRLGLNVSQFKSQGTKYDPSVEEWSASSLLGEHVGGSAVRSICFVSKIHKLAADVTNMPNGINRLNADLGDRENPCLLISVGAKRVLTCWKQKNRITKFEEEASMTKPHDATGSGFKPSSRMFSPMSFQWLSTDMPNKYYSTCEIRENTEKVGTAENVVGSDAAYASPFPEARKIESKIYLGDKYENDWRYLAVTAFLVEVTYSRLTVCFIIVACSDATLALRALLLPYRLWFDVALLVPLPSPVLALQHIIIPMGLPSEDNVQTGSVYLLISGSTDGSITFWDLTESVENFIRSVSDFHIEKSIDCQKRPRTGRGSQGGRWWKALGSGISTKNRGDNSVTARTIEGTGKNMLNTVGCGTPSKCTDSERGATACTQPIYTPSIEEEKLADSSLELCRIWPLKILNNIHQSGVNCLHISSIQNNRGSNFAYMYYALSGGDDQALHCLGFDLQILPSNQYSENQDHDIGHGVSESMNNFIHHGQNQNYSIRFFYHDKVASAHSSSVKGIWTDGCWVFSTGLDQRIRCWLLDEHGKLKEYACLIISVPEPEALDARTWGKDSYQIIVAGRGMQMVEFSTSCGMDNGD